MISKIPQYGSDMARKEKERLIWETLGSFGMPKSRVPELGKIGGIEKLLQEEIFSTHPNPASRPEFPYDMRNSTDVR